MLKDSYTAFLSVMKTKQLLWVLCFLLLAVTPRLLSLDAHWSSDESRWLRRSAEFMSAVKQGEFSETAIAYHPGVTTMWIAGLRTFFTEPSVNIENLSRARWFIGVVVSIGISIASLLVYQLFGRWVALGSFACLAFSPLFLAQTRRVHTDALAATFILLTVLLFLVYCQNRHRHRYLILSGITFGLALLSKSYALILLPWIPMCLFLFREKGTGGFLTRVAAGIVFLNCAAFTILVLWPVFWTLPFGILSVCLLGTLVILSKELKKEAISLGSIPLWASIIGLSVTCIRGLQIVSSVFDRVKWAVTTPHEVEHFFLSEVVNDPGWLFYPFVLVIKSTPLMLPLAIIGCILLWRQRKQTAETGRYFRMALALVTGALLFTVCLSATSKKFSRYLLPAFPLLEILAAIGFIEGLKWCSAMLVSRFKTQENAIYKTTLAVIACIGFFFIQVMPVMARHPYYGTYYNLCWKATDITKIITVGEASGLDIAAHYLNKKNDPENMTVQVSPLATEFVRYYFQGIAYRSDRNRGHTPDYEIVYIRDSQIGRVPQTGTLNGELEACIALNGIDHVWIYRIPDAVETGK